MTPVTRRPDGSTFYYGKCVGEVQADVDGFYKWWPMDNRGYLDECFLGAMAQFLHSLNAEWEAQVQRDLSS